MKKKKDGRQKIEKVVEEACVALRHACDVG